MALRARPPPDVRLFGGETEYALALLDRAGRRRDPRRAVAELIEHATRAVAHLPCSGPYDVFTANGSRLYVDCGLHPELATPECTTPEEIVRFTRAGDRLLARAARAIAAAHRDEGLEPVLWKGNIDHASGATWGSHESYLHRAPQKLFAEQLMPHLVTRIVYTGAGGFDNRARSLELVISPRAFHLEHAVAPGSTGGRGIFHTRDEPLAGGGLRRLHVLAGESLWSETADWLRFGTTALLVALVDAGRRPANGLALASPVDALRTVARDTTCRAPLARRFRAGISALAVQRRLLERVEAELGTELLPAWADTVCARWREVLDALEAGPETLAGVLDWPTKLAILRRQLAASGLARDAEPGPLRRERFSTDDAALRARLLETDIRFNRLDDAGIFSSLDAAGALAHRVVNPEAVERAIDGLPAAGRGRARAALVQSNTGRKDTMSCYWDRIYDYAGERMLALDDPFASEPPPWQPLPEAAASRRRVRVRA